MMTKDELFMLKGNETVAKPKEVSISKSFNDKNLTTVDHLLDIFTEYARQRWPGLGEGLTIRVTKHLWSTVQGSHQCRSAEERAAFLKQFRSVYFEFTFFEKMVLESWMSLLLELLPPWMRKAIWNDIKTNLTESGLESTVDNDESESLADTAAFNEISMTSQSVTPRSLSSRSASCSPS